MKGKSLYDYPIHLGKGARAFAEPQFTGLEWYEAYGERHADDLEEGRLVSLFRFEESWTSWEMHPPRRRSGLRRPGSHDPAPGAPGRRDTVVGAWPRRLCNQSARGLAHGGRGGAGSRAVHYFGQGHDAPAAVRICPAT